MTTVDDEPQRPPMTPREQVLKRESFATWSESDRQEYTNHDTNSRGISPSSVEQGKWIQEGRLDDRVGPPPDGGGRAWTQVLMTHLVVCCTWGIINSFGAFQTYYARTLGHSLADISWIGSVQIFLVFFIGAFSGRVTDAGYFRVTVAAGSVFLLVGIFAMSWATKYWQLFLAQGICMGIGNGLMFCPSLALVASYFSGKRSLAIGLAACGGSTGGLIFPAIIQQLLPRIGFAWTVRVLGFLLLALVVVVHIGSRPRPPSRIKGPYVEWEAFKDPTFLLFTIGMFISFWGVYFAYYYIGNFGRDIIDLNQTQSITLFLVINGVGYFGRLVPNYYGGDRWFGPVNSLIPMVFLAGILLLAWIGVHDQTGLVVFAVFYGLCGAGIQSLFPAAIVSVIVSSTNAGVSNIGARMGMIFTVVSFACLTGPPIAGVFIKRHQGAYLYAQLFGALSLISGCLILVAARIVKTGWVFRCRI